MRFSSKLTLLVATRLSPFFYGGTSFADAGHLIQSRTSSGGDCSSKGIPFATLPESKLLSLTAIPVTKYNTTDATGAQTFIDFCNVTITYTHMGWNDSITVTVWLPQNDWTGRFVGVGGGGWSTRPDDSALAAEVVAGRSAAITDGGHGRTQDTASWALDSKNNVNLLLLQDFASVSLNDASIIGKAVTKSFYGQKPHHSYWNGCSTGGRQGHMMAS